MSNNKELFKCSETRHIVKKRIYCPTCDQDYRIYDVLHHCNPLLPCEGVKNKLVENYIKKLEIESAVIARCDRCIKKEYRVNKPRHLTCPKCKYSGRYSHSGDMLCPACSGKSLLPISDQLADQLADQPAMLNNISLINITLYPTVVTTGSCPSDGVCTQIIIHGVTQESLTTPDWFVVKKTWILQSPDDYAQTMDELGELLGNLRSKYNTIWADSRRDIGWLWLKYLYENAGTRDRPAI